MIFYKAVSLYNTESNTHALTPYHVVSHICAKHITMTMSLLYTLVVISRRMVVWQVPRNHMAEGSCVYAK